MTWGHGFLKQIKATSTRPLSVSTPVLRTRATALHCSYGVEMHCQRILCISREDLSGYIPCMNHHLDLAFLPKWTPHTMEKASIGRERKKISKIRLYKQCQNEDQCSWSIIEMHLSLGCRHSHCLTWSSPVKSYPWSDSPKPAIHETTAYFAFFKQQSTLLKIHEMPQLHPYDFNDILLLRSISITRLFLLSARP